MHIQKLLSAMICMSVLAGGLEAKAADTDVQAKARELLRQKQAELDATNNAAATAVPPAPAVPPPVVPAPPQTPSPEVVAPVAPPPPVAQPMPPRGESIATPVPQPIPTVTPVAPAPVEPAFSYGNRLTPEQEAKVREATRKAIEDLNTQTPAAPVAPAPVAVVAAPIPGVPQPVPVVAAPYDAKKEAADEKAAQKAEAKLIAQQQKEAKKAAAYQPAPVPAPAPAYAAPNSKEGRLYDLLQRYNRDEITPADYHEQRAKILAEP